MAGTMRLMIPVMLCALAAALVLVEGNKHKEGAHHKSVRVRMNDKPRCRYDRNAEWTVCGPGVEFRKKVMTLKPGQRASCPPTRTKTKPCKHRKNKVVKHRKKGRGRACKYRKGPWMPCNEATKLRSRKLTLKKGDPKHCNATLVIVKRCRRRGALTGARTSRCRYKALPWGSCDSRTDTMTRILQLKAGDPTLCRKVKVLRRKCRRLCKFSRGHWSACNHVTGIKTRVDHLRRGDRSVCNATRVITKVCKREPDCKYSTKDWGECDQQTQQRTRIKKLVKGDPAKCKAEIKDHRPCKKANGEDHCFLGSWGHYGPCQNGVMMKHRRVIAGGVECERKAVKTRPCS